MSNLKYKHTAYTSAQWASLNPVIVENEIVIESDTKRTKIGNGISTYNELEYADANSVGNSLGSIKPTDAAPTPARNGNYTFSIGGNKPAWLTAEAGVTTVKAGDGVAVVYAAPSTYSYTHIDIEGVSEAAVNEINGAIKSLIPDSNEQYFYTIPIGTFEQGAINTGVNGVAANRLRSLSLGIAITSPSTLTGTINAGFRFAVRYGTALDTITSDSGWLASGAIFAIPTGTNYFRLVVSKTDDSNIVPSDAHGLSILYNYTGLKAVASKESLDLLKSSLPLKLNLNLGSFEQGALDTLGVNQYANTRLRMINLGIWIKSPCDITGTINAGFRFAVRWGTIAGTTPGDSGWLTTGAKVTIPSGYSYVRVLISKTDNSVIVASDAHGCALVYRFTGFLQDISDEVKYRFLPDENSFAINHRGFNSVAPENTLEAFKLSAINGYKYVETDVRFTSDNVPVLLHDATIDRTSDGSGNISTLTFAQARAFDFGSWKHIDYTGVKIPSFEEFIYLCMCLNINPVIEIQASYTLTSAQVLMLLDIVKKYGMTDKCIWISFSAVSLLTFLNYKKNATVALLVNDLSAGNLTAVNTLVTGLNKVYLSVINTGLTDAAAIKAIQITGIDFMMWASADLTSAEYITLAKLGIVGYTVDAILPQNIMSQTDFYLS